VSLPGFASLIFNIVLPYPDSVKVIITALLNFLKIDGLLIGCSEEYQHAAAVAGGSIDLKNCNTTVPYLVHWRCAEFVLFVAVYCLQLF
jgi:hypothetical protein